ncbi:MAG TPA: hypothetical protein VFQ60_02415 [Patescibacteria group bacterium]|nr:hypothetical protein [Patescibacteria group bacterium]
MAHALISIRDLLVKSWRQFTRDWTRVVRISAWWLLIPVLSGVRQAIQYGITFGANESEKSVAIIILALFVVLLVFGVANIVISLMTTIRLIAFTLERDHDAQAKIPSWNWNLFGPMLWILILLVFVQLIPMFIGFLVGWILYPSGISQGQEFLAIAIGFLVYLIPGIYLSNLFSFSMQSLIEDDLHGRAALVASAKLVKGRWWQTFWRQFVPGLIFALITLVLVVLLIFIISMITMGVFAVFHIQVTLAIGLTILPIAAFGLFLIPYLVNTFLLPYFIISQAKLFHSMKSVH